MFTDMVGSTSAAQSDEAGALKLRDEQARLVRPRFTAHLGREIKSMGDGFLVEFESALRAVQCAIDIQQHLHERNSVPGRAPILLRIGVHLGDVEQRAADIFGDAVNIASRIEPVAEPEGICLSGAVHEQVQNKIPFKLEKLPPTALKGVHIPIELYRVVLPWGVRAPPSASSGPARLAVLPFANISPDPKDEYFADGLTDELITVLSQLRELRVIARTSVAPYKSASKGVAQVGAELGVTAILEGTVRKFGDELRITAQLIDVGTQEHTWAASYDRKLDKVFVVQSEIARQVAEALKVKLKPVDENRLATRPTVRPESYLAYLKGRTLLHDRSEKALRQAKENFELAVSLDGTNAAALSGLSDATRLIGVYRRDSPLEDWDQASRTMAERAVALDPNLAEAHTSLGYSLWSDYDYTRAETEFRLATSLSPSYAPAHLWYAGLLADENRPDEALAQLVLAQEADPLSLAVIAAHAVHLLYRGQYEKAREQLERLEKIEDQGLLFTRTSLEFSVVRGDYPRALSGLKRLEELSPGEPEILVHKGSCVARMGQTQRARDCLKELEGLNPGRRPNSGIAQIYAYLGELDPCFLWLRRSAFETYDMDVGHWRSSPLFEQVRGDPRFQVLLREMNLA
jgi:adenylate cyclase